MRLCDRSPHGFLWRPIVLLLIGGLGLLHGSGHVNTVAAKPSADVAVGTKILSQQSEDMAVETNILSEPGKGTAVETKIFSEKWAAEYSEDDLGCEMGRGSYTWRPCGFGSNINNLLNSWVHALAKEGWSDLSVLVGDDQLADVECSHASRGLASRGWSCIFSSIPHVCVFDTPEMWQRHMNSSGVSEEEYREADRLTLTTVSQANLATPLQAFGIDQLGAKTVMAKMLWNSVTPWLQADVRAVTHKKETFQRSPFVGMHIRRGDKVRGNNNIWHGTEAYLAAALSYLEEEPTTRTPADEIKGVWVASDDETVVDEVRALAHKYFPNVLEEDIVYVSGGVPGGVQFPGVTTWSMNQVYASFVYLLADFEMMAASDVFVGTFSSNMGRLVLLLREGVGKERSSCISLDYNWHPNRQLDLVETEQPLHHSR